MIFIFVPIVLVQKYVYTKIINKIPRSRITPAPDRNPSEPAIEMKSILRTPNVNDVESIGGMNIEEFLEEKVRHITKVPFSYNVTKNNKNLISFSGIFILFAFFLVFTGIVILSRFGWISTIHTQFYGYIYFCCLPVILPTVYFMRKPNHLVVVMKDLNIL